MGTRSNRNLVTLARSISLLGCRPPRNCVSSFVQFLRLPDLFVTRRNHLTLPFVVFHWLPYTNGFVFHYRVVCWLNPEIVKFSASYSWKKSSFSSWDFLWINDFGARVVNVYNMPGFSGNPRKKPVGKKRQQWVSCYHRWLPLQTELIGIEIKDSCDR